MNLILSWVLLLFFQLPVFATQSVTLAWDPSGASNVAGYKIYSGTVSHIYTNVVAVGNTTVATISGLVAGTTCYFAATTLDSAGNKSAFSDEFSYVVPLITPTITTPPTASVIIYGQTLASAVLTGGLASTAGSFAFTTPGFAPNAGTANVPVIFTPNDTNDFTPTTALVVVTVTPATASVTLGNLSQPYDGTPKPVSVTTSPAGLNVAVTYNASSIMPTNAGSYRVVAAVDDPNYTGSATNTLVIGQATASVTLGDLSQSFDGTPKPVSVTTSPAGLNVAVMYNASSIMPTNAGGYRVVATVDDPNYTGSATSTLVIGQATANVTLDNLNQSYDGAAKPVTASTMPINLNVVLTYNDSTNAFTNAGSYTVVGTIEDPNYQGSVTNTLNITSALPTITTPPTASAIIYGQTLASSVLTGGLASTAGSFAFTRPGFAPNPGTANVPVTFTPNDTNDFTPTTALVVVTVTQATASVTLGDLSQSFDGTPKPVSVTTSPAGLNVAVTYDASLIMPTNAGSYRVVATVNDPNYTGSATNTLVIGPATVSVTLGDLSQSFDGTPKPVRVTTSPAGLNVEVTYNASSIIPTNAGSYRVVATVNDPNYSGSVTNTLVIGPATASVTLDNLNQSYDGAAKPVTASTMPMNLNVVLTYNDSTNAFTNVGSYTVVGTIEDPNHQGSVTNTLNITPAMASIVTPSTGNLTSPICSGGQFSFTISGITGQQYVVQASTNLVDWVSVETNTAPFVFTDADAESFDQRFYRASFRSPQ